MHTADELSAMTLFQRLKTADWRLELFTIVFTLVFVIFYKAGDLYNYSKVSAFLGGVKDVFEKNFYLYGVGNGKLYVKDSSESYSSYATGRENIAKVNLNFRLAPRQNVLIWIMESLFGYFTESVPVPEDRVEIVIHPSADYENFVSAVVSKNGMNDYRKANYYLSLTRTTDSPLLPESFVFMSESNEFQEKTFTTKFADSLTLSMANFLRFVAFTDQPVERPEALRDLLPQKRIVISLKLVTGKEELAQISNVLAAVFDIVDQIANNEITFKPEASRKIVKAREAEIAKIKKVEEVARQEELAEEKAKLKRQERDELRSLSRDEQLKAEKKAQEKKQKKMQKKMRVKM